MIGCTVLPRSIAQCTSRVLIFNLNHYTTRRPTPGTQCRLKCLSFGVPRVNCTQVELVSLLCNCNYRRNPASYKGHETNDAALLIRLVKKEFNLHVMPKCSWYSCQELEFVRIIYKDGIFLQQTKIPTRIQLCIQYYPGSSTG